jgi:hypothetical protein
VIYLSGVTGPALRELNHPRIGLMIQPGNGLARQAHLFPAWAADNACLNQGEVFHGGRWLSWLSRLPTDRCLFAVAPDVLGDPDATLASSLPWLSKIRQLGMPAAYVAQDGAVAAGLPWDEFDVLFAGGSVEWKLSSAMYDLAAAARARGKRTHMGKVNSSRRIRAAASAGYDSVDGTFLGFRARKKGRGYEADRGPQEVAAWLEYLETHPFLPMEVTS